MAAPREEAGAVTSEVSVLEELSRRGRALLRVILTANLMAMLAMLAVASVFHDRGGGYDTIEEAHAGFDRLVGPGAALAFALALLASGLAASSVGTYAGQVVMQGFIRRRSRSPCGGW